MKGQLLVLLLLPCTLFAQPNWDTVKIRPLKLADNLYMMTGSGGNMALLTGHEGNLLVDDQFAPLSDKIKAAIADLDPWLVRFVINTHLHGDHSGGNENFKKVGATLMAHDNVRARMMKESVDRQGNTVPPRDKEALPMVTFANRLNVHLNGEDIELIHLDNGHTDGDVAIVFRRANVIHAGDAFVRNRYPYIDVTSGGNFGSFLRELEQVYNLANDETRIIPGHGTLGTRADVKALHDKLADIGNKVRAAMKKGTKVEDIPGLGITDKYEEELGKGFTKGKDFVLLIAEYYKSNPAELKK